MEDQNPVAIDLVVVEDALREAADALDSARRYVKLAIKDIDLLRVDLAKEHLSDLLARLEKQADEAIEVVNA